MLISLWHATKPSLELRHQQITIGACYYDIIG